MNNVSEKWMKEKLALLAVDRFQIYVTLTFDSNVIFVIWNLRLKWTHLKQ